MHNYYLSTKMNLTYYTLNRDDLTFGKAALILPVKGQVADKSSKTAGVDHPEYLLALLFADGQGFIAEEFQVSAARSDIAFKFST